MAVPGSEDGVTGTGASGARGAAQTRHCGLGKHWRVLS